ncbi:MAG TPA: transcription antitermination factor NusB [Vicinamibacterales bacterium]|nr:transcription antitermination factor NusB [Vicinamibacterales bacterium]
MTALPDDEQREPGPDTRRRGREAALQMLYHWEIGRLSMPEVRESFWRVGQPDVGDASERIRAFAERLATGTADAVAQTDPLIEAQAAHWRLERMAVIDRLILRMAVYEFLHEPETPRAVVIEEAIRLAKRFSTPDAVRFVNGVLDGVRRRLDETSAGDA